MYRLFTLMLILLFPSLLIAETNDRPQLKLELGSHAALITDMSSSDHMGRYVATTSRDHTTRVWDIRNGILKSILRPPIGLAGSISGVAVSFDGRYVAVGTGRSKESMIKNNLSSVAMIYIFDINSGDVVRTVSAPKNSRSIFEIAFSPDGNYLSFSYNFLSRKSKQSGFSVLNTNTWKTIGSEVLNDWAPSIDISSANEIVSSGGGLVQLYEIANDKIKIIKQRKIKDSLTVKFSPNLSRIALKAGRGPSKKILLLDAKSLSQIGVVDTGESAVYGVDMDWSPDGEVLYAKSGEELFQWDEGGSGVLKDQTFEGSYGTRNVFSVSEDGSLILTSGSAGLFSINSNGEENWNVSNPTRLAKNKFSLKLGMKGNRVALIGDTTLGIPDFIFDIAKRDLVTENIRSDEDLFPPLLKDPRLNLSARKDNRSGRETLYLNNKRVDLENSWASLDYAIAQGGYGFAVEVLGNVSYFNRKGILQWRLTDGSMQMNISRDGRFVVCNHHDGIIRWYSRVDGTHLLSLFVTYRENEWRWIAWTHSGYYDASPGAEGLIGWQVNRGIDQAADFFPSSRFRGTYYRPDIIETILETLNEDESIRLANIKIGRKRQEVDISNVLPPVISILNYFDDSQITSEQLNLKVFVRSPSGKSVTGIKVLVDGRPVARERGISLNKKQASGTRDISVKVPPRNCEVSVIAETADTASTPATIKLVWAKHIPQQDVFVAKPKLYVLAIGVSDYKDPELKLGLAAKDAQDFASTVKKQAGGLYREVITKVLTNDLATKDDILDGLDWLVQETTSRDVAMLFLAGHGINDPYGKYYYLPQNTNLDRLKRTGVPFSDIKDTLASLAGKALFFVDTCHSGNVMGTRRAAPTDINGLVNELSSAENGAVVFASSTGRQYSLEDPAWGNGAFTKALVEGFSGKADYTGKGKISINMLDLYLSERVKELTKGRQTPTTTKPQTIQDFPIAVKL